MEMTITLGYGPLDAEFTGKDQEEIQDNLLQFMEFLEENGELFDGIEFSSAETGDSEDPGLDPDFWEEQQAEAQEKSGAESADIPVSFGAIPNRIDYSEGTLAQYFDIDPEGEEPPYLNFDADVLGESGNSRSEKQMRGSLILLTLWRECEGVDEITSSTLKDALRISGVNDEALYNMYGFNDNEGDRYFKREGTGASTDISLTMPGKREGYDQIQRTVARLEGDVEE